MTGLSNMGFKTKFNNMVFRRFSLRFSRDSGVIVVFRFSSGPKNQNLEAVVLCLWCRGNFRGLSQTETRD